MRIIEKKKKLRAILAALIILIGKRLNWSKISSVIENHVLICAIRFFLFVFAFFSQILCDYAIFYEVLLKLWQTFPLVYFLFIFFFLSS